MKKINFICTIICTLIISATLAQTPQGISHQAIVRNASNQLIVNSQIGIKVSIIQDNVEGTVVYSETFTLQSNANGLISFVIGQGSDKTNDLNTINWADGNYFIKTEVDPEGGTNYTITGSSQLWSIPYAFYSQKSETLKDGTYQGEILFWEDGKWQAIEQGINGQILQLCDNIPTWTWGKCKFLVELASLPENAGIVEGAGEYKAGMQVNISVQPNTGWEFLNWTDINDNVVTTQTYYSFVMPADDLVFFANFEIINYSLILDINPESGGSVDGAGIYNYNDIVDISATPNDGWYFLNWTETNGNIVSDQSSYSFNMPSNDYKLYANFEMIDFTLILNSNPENGGTVTGAGLYKNEDIVSISATPSEGWSFTNWTDIDGNIISDQESYIFSMPAEDMTLTANFIMIDYILTLNANPQNGGFVTGAGSFNYGENVNISADPNEGWGFENWTDIDGNIISDQESYSFSMPAENITLTANFIMIDYTLTLNVNPIDVGTVYGAGIYNFGDNVEINAIPDEEWIFVNWTDNDGNLVSDQASYSFNMPAEDITMIANFELKSYLLTLLVNPENAGTVIGSGDYFPDDIANISATPNEGWSFTNWTDPDGNIISEQTAYDFSMPSKDFTLTANFEMATYILTLDVNPENSGTVSGAGTYNYGANININATPNDGWIFEYWTDQNDNILSQQTAYSFTMPAENLTLTANFYTNPYPLCGTETVTDKDGNIYNTVLIGKQCWMASNLKVTKNPNGQSITRHCYNGDANRCNEYGGLYDWNTVMNGAGSSNTNPSGVQGICPNGWHVPSEAELNQMLDYVDANVTNGTSNALKSCRQISSPLGWPCNTQDHPRWNATTYYGTDDFGWGGYPGGTRAGGGTQAYSGIGSIGYWHSSTEGSQQNYSLKMRIHASLLNADIQSLLGSNRFSLRCLKD